MINHVLFRYIYSVAQLITENTFDYLPDATAKYPFIYFGESFNNEANNVELYGEITQTVHIYGLRTDRKTLDDWSAKLLQELRNNKSFLNYKISYKKSSVRDLQDNTDVQPLIHRVLEVDFFYNKERN
ncbi:hypothetical protein IR073_06480 [Gemella sp. 19428wG2_WT2a]|nr:hypothetical protein [Gemella sp. 19428wG2_WT2a]TFU57682.1 hypothetical protein E4T67_06405 [Gemella sp. WT2a]